MKKTMRGDSVSEVIICENAKELFEELGVKTPNTVTVKSFFSTKVWFTGFRKITALHNVMRYDQTASANMVASFISTKFLLLN